jgi:protein-tyrosine phosphatase
MSTHHDIDAHEVHERIWVGSVPQRGGAVASRGFTHLVLCADDFQFPAEDFPGVTVLHAPFVDADTVVPRSSMTLVFVAARAVAEAHRGGAKALVTCAAGINRSALVACVAMQMLGVEPWISVERVRALRFPYCLSNEAFKRIALGANREVSFFLPRST